jgi:hypothetical protein
VDRDEFSYFPYLIAGGRGELAATWSSGKDDTLQAHVAKIDVRGSKALPQVIEAKPFQIDVWSRVLEEHPTPVHRTTGGEYIPVVFLRSGSWELSLRLRIGPRSDSGFTWWKFVTP